MISRIESHRKTASLPVAATLYHALEAVGAAYDRTRDSGNDDLARALRAHRDMLLVRLATPQIGEQEGTR